MTKARIIKMLEMGTSPDEILPSLNERDNAIYELLKQGDTFKEIQFALSASPNQIAFINKYFIKKHLDSIETVKPDTFNSDAEPESIEPVIKTDIIKPTIKTVSTEPAIKPDIIKPAIIPDVIPTPKQELKEPAPIVQNMEEPVTPPKKEPAATVPEKERRYNGIVRRRFRRRYNN